MIGQLKKEYLKAKTNDGGRCFNPLSPEVIRLELLEAHE